MIGLAADMVIGRSRAFSSFGMWTVLGIDAGVVLFAILVAVAVTHLSIRRSRGGTAETTVADANA